jgi:2-C-methyl-D-erythritol 4-phosphate cytidylyltransferase/2-C-methyl-D-erythritol 2,4-cyclodiphosphate synthase
MSPSSPKPIPAPSLPVGGRAFALVTAAGSSTRYGGAKKEFESLGGLTVLERALEPFMECCAGIVVTCPAGARHDFEAFFAKSTLHPALSRLAAGFEIVEGGAVRQESVRLGLRALAGLGCASDIVLIHDGARPWISHGLIMKTLERARARGASLPLTALTETPKIIEGEYIHTHPARTHMMTAQTPQAFSFPEILAAHELAAREHYSATDDAMIWDHYVGPVSWVEGERRNRKITFKEDIMNGAALRTGIGYDIHPLVEGRPLLLAGVRVESERGEAGYSDGDVLWHAIIDAALGAAALGDIGSHFPPGAPEWKNADSTELARTVFKMVKDQGFVIVNLDCNVICERPKLGPYQERIRAAVAETFELPPDAVSFKAKTKEGFDATGRGEAIEAQALVLLERR